MITTLLTTFFSPRDVEVFFVLKRIRCLIMVPFSLTFDRLRCPCQWLALRLDVVGNTSDDLLHS